jgi:hypothetical protein
MDSIEQLKVMRDSARDRIEASPDYKLMTKLTVLIEELEEAFGPGEAAPAVAEESGEAADEEVDSPPAPVDEEIVGALANADEAVDIDTGEELIADGEAQLDIEETPVTSPIEEVAGEAPVEPQDTLGLLREAAADTDAALKQAMEELEADLSGSVGDPKASRFRYGNST